MSGFKRNGHWVRSNVQRAVLFRFLLHWVAFAAAFVGVSFCLHVFLSEPGETAETLLHQMWQRYSLVCIVAVALVPYFLYDLMKFTHRFAGPMVRLGNALHRAAQGETVEPIKFRKGDYWQEFATDLNTVLLRIPCEDSAHALLSQLSAEHDDASSDESVELVTT